jgi:hypothetical protein
LQTDEIILFHIRFLTMVRLYRVFGNFNDGIFFYIIRTIFIILLPKDRKHAACKTIQLILIIMERPIVLKTIKKTPTRVAFCIAALAATTVEAKASAVDYLPPKIRHWLSWDETCFLKKRFLGAAIFLAQPVTAQFWDLLMRKANHGDRVRQVWDHIGVKTAMSSSNFCLATP